MEVQEAASRLLACPRLSREREAERQRAIQRPLTVAWKEKVEDGQVFISISSDDEEDNEEDEEPINPPIQQQFQAIPGVKTELQYSDREVVTIESDSDEVDDEIEAEEEKPIRVRRKLEVLEPQEEDDDADYEEDVKMKDTIAAKNPIDEEQQQVGVRKRRLGEEDAAFLLFYGERESPSANILRLIIDLIECGVGSSDLFLSRFIKYMLWCKLNIAVEAVRREGRFTNFEKVIDILLKLMSDPRNRHGVFNTPVDPVALELPTYTTIVKHPMDLGTIKRNLTAGEYLELEDFVADVRLVCGLYNPVVGAYRSGGDTKPEHDGLSVKNTEFFCDNVCQSSTPGNSTPSASFVSVKEENGVGVSTRGTTVQSVNPDELVWPANHVPPIFDGDIIPSELERILGRIVSRNEKQERASRNKKLAVVRTKNGKVARMGGKFSVGNVVLRIKEETSTAEPPAAAQVNVKLRELFNKLQFAIQRLKNDLLVVELEVEGEEESKGDESSIMELTLEAVAKDSFRRDFFLRCFSEREAQALELRFSFLHRVRQYKRLVGRRDLLPRAAKDIATSYLQHVESTDQLLLPPSAESLRNRVLNAVTSGHCPLDLFCGMETIVRDHMTRDAFPHFLRSTEYLELCDALRARRDLPLAEVLVDSRRTQFLMRFLSEEFPGEEGNLRFWVHVQTRFLSLIQTTLFSVALFEEVQRHVRHVFNKFLVTSSDEKEGDDASSAATQVPEDGLRMFVF
ncbi:hypothetical protein BBO99_00002736 [Phytophthora kernoviae]|uniref:Bromo domain-containing protein n=1 Tax=Phytophthora kernoviae TaxID=325452 RepID=A0A3R7MTS1_9STRA|nr:hypothetical protein JM16_003688 [Phytophthora kernoviae]RLN37184.1 hypothetical protein BBI17_004240 [Phytophthora kernoviae]RLN82685.1 hypothetical protein BBO99_00002736 [Phytophthora kernoviae]